jgi:release factor glutamine methyltransferase
VEAVDISPDALALAHENAARLCLTARVQFSEANLLAAAAGEFQLIVANLPYVDSAAESSLAREVRHDPPLALYGGPGGLQILRQLIAEATRHLRGLLALEIGYDQAPAVCETLGRHNYQDIRVLCDYHGRQRFVFAIYG